MNIVSKVNVTGTNITNIATGTSDTYDPNETNNEDNETIEINPIVDLEIVKTVDNHNPKKGDIVIWTVTVTNNGPDTAVNVVVSDVIPAGLIYVDSDGDYANNVWNIGDLDCNETVVLNIRTLVDVTDAVVINVANVTSDTPESDLTNNNDSATVDIGHEADLEVIKVVSNSTPKKGDIITWTVTVTNNGPDRAVDVVVSDDLPAGLIYVSDESNGKYNNDVWDIGTLEFNASVTLVITTKVNVSNANITNVAVVESDTYDPNETNNEDNDTIEVDPICDVAIVKSVDNHNPKKGDIITWTVTVTNNGPDKAVNVIVGDVIPSSLEFVDYNGDNRNGVWIVGTLDSTDYIWFIGDLDYNESVTLNIRNKMDVTDAVITNVASVTTSTPESDLTNNNDSATIDIGHEADLEVIKVVSDPTPNYGDEITWTVTVTNNGPDRAVDVIVTDVLPAGLIYVSDDSNGKYNNDVWDIGTLENNVTVILVITTKVDVSNANITNVAVVESDTHDPDETNNEDNDTIEVPPMADLEVIKVVSNSKPHNGDEIIWTISVFNHGPQDAVNVIVYDTLPDGLIYVSDDGEGAYDSETGIWEVGDLHHGRGLILNILTYVNVSNTNITNIANAVSDTYDPNETNNEDNDTVNVPPMADLEITKVVSDINPVKGDIIIWSVIVINNGPDAAVNVVVSDVLPAGLIFIDSDGDYADNVWNIGDLNNNETVVLNIRTMVNVTDAVVTNVANVTSDTPDIDLTNNNDSATLNVPPMADLELIKVVSNTNPYNGDEIIWTITVINNGPDTSENVIVNEILPYGIELVSAKASKGVFLNEVWTVGNLTNGESASLMLTTKVLVDGVLENTVIANSSTYDPNTTNNKDTEIANATNKTLSADLMLTKVANVDKVKVGDKIVWTITVINVGPDKATNVIVNDRILYGDVAFVSSNVTKGHDNPLYGIWYIGDLDVGESVVWTIVFEALSEGYVINHANVTSDIPDPNPENNEYISVVEVVNQTAPETPGVVKTPEPTRMYATGTPIVMVFLALISIAGVTLRRKD